MNNCSIYTMNSSVEYRYGFNGQEKEDEITSTSGSHLDFGARIYDSRIGRWLAVDPKCNFYSSNSPYNYVLNSPIYYNDYKGATVIPYGDNFSLVSYVNATFGKTSVASFFANAIIYGTIGEKINSNNQVEFRIKGYMLNKLDPTVKVSRKEFDKMLCKAIKSKEISEETSKIALALFKALDKDEVVQIGVLSNDMTFSKDNNISLFGGEIDKFNKINMVNGAGREAEDLNLVDKAIEDATDGSVKTIINQSDVTEIKKVDNMSTVTDSELDGDVFISVKKDKDVNVTNKRISEGLQQSQLDYDEK